MTSKSPIIVVSDEGYGWAEMAPGIENEQFNARHNTLRAHARAFKVYNEEFRQTQNGKAKCSNLHMSQFCHLQKVLLIFLNFLQNLLKFNTGSKSFN